MPLPYEAQTDDELALAEARMLLETGIWVNETNPELAMNRITRALHRAGAPLQDAVVRLKRRPDGHIAKLTVVAERGPAATAAALALGKLQP